MRGARRPRLDQAARPPRQQREQRREVPAKLACHHLLLCADGDAERVAGGQRQCRPGDLDGELRHTARTTPATAAAAAAATATATATMFFRLPPSPFLPFFTHSTLKKRPQICVLPHFKTSLRTFFDLKTTTLGSLA